MARQSLDSLLGNTAVEDLPAARAAEQKPQTSREAAMHLEEQTASTKAPESESEPRPSTRAVVPEPSEAKYLTLVRKEARLREEQYANLTEKSRQLNRAKKGGERITENTLIRVAIDLLWAQAENLKGIDETELRKSVGL